METGAIGGEDNLVHREIIALRTIGQQVFVCNFQISGFKRKLHQLRAQLFGSNRNLLKLIKVINPDIILCHNLQQSSGYKWMKKVKIPIVMSLHNYRLFCSISIAWRDGKTCIQCNNGNFLKVFKYNCGDYKAKLNAVRKILFRQPERKIPKLYLSASNLVKSQHQNFVKKANFYTLGSLPNLEDLKATTLSDKKSGFIFAGRIEMEKGILELVDVWPENVDLDIYGNGTQIKELELKIRTKRYIRLFDSFNPSDTQILRKYKALIFPSLWMEGSPLIVTEAIACGTPVITTNLNSASELIMNAGAGVIIKDINRTEILRAINDVELNQSKYSKNAKEFAHKHLIYPIWGNKLKSELEKVLFESDQESQFANSEIV